MVARLEETAQWKEYAKLSPKQREERIELISQALVETYVQLDKDLLLLEESGLMVRLVCLACMLLMWWLNYVSRNLTLKPLFAVASTRMSLAAPVWPRLSRPRT
jgi:hypothetical protein